MIDQTKVYTNELVRLNKKYLIAIDYVKVSVPVTGTAVTLTLPDGATYCEIAVESATTTGVLARFLITGETPTATDGMPLLYLDRFDITGRQNLENFKVIDNGIATTLHIQYYK